MDTLCRRDYPVNDEHGEQCEYHDESLFPLAHHAPLQGPFTTCRLRDCLRHSHCRDSILRFYPDDYNRHVAGIHPSCPADFACGRTLAHPFFVLLERILRIIIEGNRTINVFLIFMTQTEVPFSR